MKGKAHFLLLALVVLAFSMDSEAQLWSGVLSPSRAIDWSQAGVVGGIPPVTSPCPTATLGVAGQSSSYVQSVTASQVRTAITACAGSSPRVLTLNPGTYNLAGGIDFTGAPNVVVRGAGADQTLVKFSGSIGCSFFAGTNVCMESSGTNGFGGDGTYDAVATWSAGFAPGNATITLSAMVKGGITGLKIGNLIFLDQLDDPSAPAGNVFYSGAQGVGSTEGSSGNGRTNRGQQQPVIVTSLCGSTTSNACTSSNAPWAIGISPATRLPNIGSRTPQAWWNNGVPLQRVGIEDMSLDYTNSGAGGGAGVFMFQCVNCWVKGVRSVNSNVISRHVWIYQGVHDSVVDSYFYGAGGAADGYGPDTFNGADNLVQNNITQHVSEPFEHEGCVGCVAAYNYSADDFYNANGNPQWQQASQYQHAVGNAFNLFEGNSYIATNSDDIHGTSNFTTIFRNYYSGRDLAITGGTKKTDMTIPVSLQTYQRFANVVGNVLGLSGYHTVYQCLAAAASDDCSNGNLAIYVVGYGGNTGLSCATDGCNSNLPNDPLSGTSMLRWGNYDTVNKAVRYSSAEVPSGLSNYANPVPSSQTIPPSFYLNSKPYWWGSAPWPAIGPDVSGGTVTNVGGHVDLTPAAICYLTIMQGPTDGTTGVLSFNADNCYASTPTAGPAAPTNLTVTVH